MLSGHKTGSQPRPFHRRICIPARPPEAAPQWHIKCQKPKTPRFWYTIFGHPGPGRIFAGHPRRNAAAAQNTPPPRALTKYPPLSSYSPWSQGILVSTGVYTVGTSLWTRRVPSTTMHPCRDPRSGTVARLHPRFEEPLLQPAQDLDGSSGVRYLQGSIAVWEQARLCRKSVV